MKHRIFIAINLPEDIKKRLNDLQKKWPDLPVRWTKKENLHITLVFLGYVLDEEIMDVVDQVKEACHKNNSFNISLKKITYGPPNKMPPRMIWAEGEKSKELGTLQKDLENALSSGQEEGRAYSPHITIGRIKTWEFRRMETDERPEIEEEINLNFDVNSVEIMESQLKRTGPEYTVLESIPLANV